MAYVVFISPGILADASIFLNFISYALLTRRAREAKPIVRGIAAVFLFKWIETGGAH